MLLNETDFKKNMPVSTSFTFKKVSPDIQRAQNNLIRPILGKDLTAILEGKYEADTLTADEQLLMDKVFPALAHLAVWLYIPKGNVFVNDQGIMSHHGTDLKPAFEWQVKQYRQSLLRNGYDALDELIAYLEEVANTDFPDWLNSEGCTLVRSYVINTAVDFSAYVNKLANSRYQFLQLVPTLNRVEKRLLPGIISQELYDAIKTEIVADNLSAANAKLMENIKGAVAHLTWAEALDELGVVIDEEGIHLINNTFSGTVDAKQSTTTTTLIHSMKKKHESISKEYADQLRDQLYANPDDYLLWKESDLYVETQPTTEIENSEDSGICMI